MSLRAYEDVIKAAADPTRVRILKILEGGEMCVCQVIAVIALGQSTISKHLFLLRAAGLIKDRRDRKWIHYSLDGKSGNPYAGTVLRNIRKWLNDDPVIIEDRKRAGLARDIGPVAICERGMGLPGRKILRRRIHGSSRQPGVARGRKRT
jgi:arsenate reductase/ArsR family transcriptional regulator